MSAAMKPNVFGKTRAFNEAWLAKAAPEPAIDPALPIIDTHMHFWHHHTGYKYFVEELGRDVAACGHNVVSTIYVECQSMYRAHGPAHLKPVGETEFAVGQAAIAASEKYTKCRAAEAIIAHADLTLGERTREALEAHIAAGHGRVKGIRQRSKWDPDPAVSMAAERGIYLTPEFGKGLDMLTSLGLSFDASVFHPEIPEVTKLAQAHPDANIVLIHTGSPVGHSSYVGHEAEVHANWLASMRELARCPNVSIKLGGILMCLGNFDFLAAERPPSSELMAELWRPYIEPCIELFGPDRCMASSNFPVEKAGIGYDVIWNLFKRITAGCSQAEKEAIFAGTARRVYRMD
jgi:L-fuconolactonase